MRFIQLNLNHCKATQDLLSQIICETCVDVAILSEQYKNINSAAWLSDSTGKAAIWACGKRAIEQISLTPEDGFVRAKIGGIFVYSCYARPSSTDDEYKQMLHRLIRDAEKHNPKIIAGDFNAWAVEWGSRFTNTRGRILLEAMSACDLVLTNSGNKPTFVARGLCSIVDLTFMSTALVRNVEWSVSDIYTHSDHMAIIFSVNNQSKRRQERQRNQNYIGWASKHLDRDTFIIEFSECIDLVGTAADKANQITAKLKRACDVAMPKRRVTENRKPNYWWNKEIADLRKICLRARRRAQRAKRTGNFEELHREYKKARSDFQHAILRSKRRHFKQICLEANTDPWGKAYRVVTSKLKGIKSPQPTCSLLLEKIVRTLFPQHHQREQPTDITVISEDIPPISSEELINIVKKIGDQKAPGPDNIPNSALKLAIMEYPIAFVDVFNQCLQEGYFPDQWKKQTLVLIPKPNKPSGEPSSYRPICLLDTIGKVLEKLIYNRLLPIVETREGLSDRQFGFRKARSTIDAIKMVMEIAQNAIAGKGASKKYCAVITLDVKNAFNSANWALIIRTLNRLGIQSYLLKIMGSYFTNRKLCYQTDEGSKTYNVTAGVPQGSILGPLLWNIMYNDVLMLDIPDEANIIGFADDIVVTISARYLDEVELLANETMEIINSWMKNAGLELAEHKTEVVLVTGRRKLQNISIKVGKCEVRSKPNLKYLGVFIDTRLNFKAHIDYICHKASNIRAAIERMMPNVGGPKQYKRRIVSTVVSSVILYAAPVWSKVLKTGNLAQRILSVHRLCALRVCSSYRTTSEDAAYVIAGMIPIDILADEAKRIYEAKQINGHNGVNIQETERVVSLEKWQSRWDESPKGRWTHKIIPNIKCWLERKHGETNYFLTQFLSGHGGYRSYLYRFGLDESPMCPCCNVLENPEHVVFFCPRFKEERERAEETVAQSLNVGNIVNILIKDERCWEAICNMVSCIHKQLMLEEERRKISRNSESEVN